MSQENVQVVRLIWEADRQHDFEAVRAAYGADIVWEDNTGLWGDWGVAHGRAAVEAAWRRWYEAFEDVEFDWIEVADAGDAVIVTYRVHARGRGSGVVVDQPLTLWWTVRGGRAVHVRAYMDRLEAMAAAGLAEQAGE